jgi:hypothetical protein
MSISAPEGPYFDNKSTPPIREKRLNTSIYVGNKKVNPNSQKVDYY